MVETGLNLEGLKYSILYVDDEEELLHLCKIFLERSGEFIVDTKLSAEEALKSIPFQSYDVIISDYEMPGINGIEFLKVVRRNYFNLPFILFTGRGREEVIIDAINYGADFYIQKGGDPKSLYLELSHKIKQALRRKSAEKLLEDSENHYFDYIDSLIDPTYAIDRQGKIIAWNKAIEEITGVFSEEIIGKGNHEYSDIFNKYQHLLLIDLIDKPENKIKALFPNCHWIGNSITVEANCQTYHGKQIHAHLMAYHLYNQVGEIIGSVESIRDITEYMKIKSKLKERDEFFRMIITQSSNIYIIISPTLEISFISPRVEYLSGFLSEEIRGSISNYIHPDDLCKIKSILEKLVDKPYSSEISEFRSLKRDGTYMLLEGMAVNCIDNPIIGGILITAWDISSQKNIEHELSRTINMFKTVMNSSNILFAIMNMEGKIRFANKTFYNYIDLVYNNSLNISIKNLFKPDWENDWIKITKEIEKNISESLYEFDICNNGKIYNLSTLFFPIQDGDSLLIGFFGLDITDSKIIQKRLSDSIDQNILLDKMLNKKTEEISNLLELKDELINGIAHELKTPLTPLTVLIPLLSIEEDKKTKTEIIKVIERNISYISNIVNKILDLARQGTMYKIEDLTPVNILILVDNLVNRYKNRIQEKEITIFCDIPQDLNLITYFSHLYSILENILSNAIKYSNKKGNIFISCNESEGNIILKIIDEGIGLSKEELPRIFEPFYKADISRHDRSSPGLGLSITRRLIQTINGKISVKSQGTGKGIEVVLTISNSKPNV
jgi:PAS domain S-box-containing protein